MYIYMIILLRSYCSFKWHKYCRRPTSDFHFPVHTYGHLLTMLTMFPQLRQRSTCIFLTHPDVSSAWPHSHVVGNKCIPFYVHPYGPFVHILLFTTISEPAWKLVGITTMVPSMCNISSCTRISSGHFSQLKQQEYPSEPAQARGSSRLIK